VTYKQSYIVISKSDKTTLGPFETREAAIAWAEGKSWVNGYVVRSLWPVSSKED
jgi:hypothetical protein